MRQDPQTQANRRLMTVAALCATWAVLILGRLFYLQVISHGDYVRVARQQQTKVEPIPAKRGSLADRNGETLAMTVPAESVCVNPMRIPDRQTAATVFARVLGLDRVALSAKLEDAAKQKRGFLWIYRKASPQQIASLKSLPFDWIEFRHENLRQYPNGSLAAHVLGSVDHQEKGNAGIEMSLNAVLGGSPGLLRLLTDSRQNGYGSEVVSKPEAGWSIKLSIDSRIQYAAEHYLAQATIENRCPTGSIVVMDPYTGDILAMANYPTFDPNEPPESERELKARQNLSVSAPYEPGSVFKVITMAAALEATRLRPDTLMDCGNGRIVLFKRVIRDHKPYGVLSLADVLAKSSNVGTIRAGLQVGDAKMHDYVRRFGFGQRTGVPLPHESPGLVWPLERWRATSLGSVAMGHELITTNLQLARATAAIANGGILVQPRLIQSRVAPDGRELAEPAQKGVRIIQERTAGTLASMMEGVVRHGTGKAAQPVGYSAAGKTGSAQIYDPQTRRYTHEYNASFAGFAPMTNPRIVVVVTLNGSNKFGGLVAAPVFKQVAAAALRVLDVRKDLPDVLPETKEPLLAMNDLPPAFEDENVAQEEAEPAPVLQAAVLGPEPAPRFLAGPKVPAFVGKTLRRVLEESASTGIPVESVGHGIARAQSPPPGAILPPGERVRIQFVR
ncbi:MAG: penicillin-binding protein [Bryobacteraceae bacterium]|nr:penicillin-binding protein [Bryobacteraceae bacterium]